MNHYYYFYYEQCLVELLFNKQGQVFDGIGGSGFIIGLNPPKIWIFFFSKYFSNLCYNVDINGISSFGPQMGPSLFGSSPSSIVLPYGSTQRKVNSFTLL
jgi:hypothetical protein